MGKTFQNETSTLFQVCHYLHAFSCFLPINFFFFISKSLTEPFRAEEMKEHVNNKWHTLTEWVQVGCSSQVFMFTDAQGNSAAQKTVTSSSPVQLWSLTLASTMCSIFSLISHPFSHRPALSSACISQILLKEVLNLSGERQAVFYWARVKVMKTSWAREKRGECEEDEKTTPLMPLNQWSPQALQRLSELCREGNAALWKAESQRDGSRGCEWSLQPLCATDKTSGCNSTACQGCLCGPNLELLNSLFTGRPTEKTEMREGNSEKGMELKLKAPLAWHWQKQRALAASH